MFSLIYIEKEIHDHPATKRILSRHKKASIIPIDRYGSIFNRNGQNFRLQKNHPALILAKKHQTFVHPTPPNYHIGTSHNYYFSHMLNCPFDCKYCFLQGMYRSANFVFFVNCEEFQKEIRAVANQHPHDCTFFTGYDADSLAMNPITHFFEDYYDCFATTQALFELRTKSASITPLMEHEPLENVLIAYSINPPLVAQKIEHKAPPIEKRIKAMQQLQKQGWQVGLRLDPIIHCKNADQIYREFLEDLFKQINPHLLHSITLGSYRMPSEFKKKMLSLYPTDPFIHSNQENNQTYFLCLDILKQYISTEKIFQCL